VAEKCQMRRKIKLQTKFKYTNKLWGLGAILSKNVLSRPQYVKQTTRDEREQVHVWCISYAAACLNNYTPASVRSAPVKTPVKKCSKYGNTLTPVKIKKIFITQWKKKFTYLAGNQLNLDYSGGNSWSNVKFTNSNFVLTLEKFDFLEGHPIILWKPTGVLRQGCNNESSRWKHVHQPSREYFTVLIKLFL